jgi:hypothetical protein
MVNNNDIHIPFGGEMLSPELTIFRFGGTRIFLGIPP